MERAPPQGLPAFQTRRLPNYGATAVYHAGRLTEQLAQRADSNGCIAFDTDAVDGATNPSTLRQAPWFSCLNLLDNGDDVATALRFCPRESCMVCDSCSSKSGLLKPCEKLLRLSVGVLAALCGSSCSSV